MVVRGGARVSSVSHWWLHLCAWAMPQYVCSIFRLFINTQFRVVPIFLDHVDSSTE